jgi:two-component system cell cycle response regulator DivK
VCKNVRPTDLVAERVEAEGRLRLRRTVKLSLMDGYTAVSRIKADPALRSIPIIAVTSYALNGEEKKARAAGCDDYVPKPYSPRELLAKIRQYIPQ